jgi:hypothetical protein
MIVTTERNIEVMNGTMSNSARLISQGTNLLAQICLDNIVTSSLSILFQFTLRRYGPQTSQ